MALLSINFAHSAGRRKKGFFVLLCCFSALCLCPVLLLAEDLAMSTDLMDPLDDLTMPLSPLSAYSGITEAVNDVTLSLPLTGRVATLFVHEGEKVEKGQLLLSFDNKLEGLEVKRRKLLWNSTVELDSAARKEETLKSLLAGTRQLCEMTGSISKEELEKQELEYILAVGARQHLEIGEQREELEYNLAVENLAKRSLRSPIQGTVIAIFIKEGEGAESNQPLVKLVDTSRCRFISNVAEQVGRTLKNGQVVDLQIKAGSSTITKEGEIIFTSPVVDPASGLLEVKVLFDNQDGQVRPGVSGYFSIKTP